MRGRKREGEGRERGRQRRNAEGKKRGRRGTESAREWEMKAMGEGEEREKEEKLAADRIDWK